MRGEVAHDGTSLTVGGLWTGDTIAGAGGPDDAG